MHVLQGGMHTIDSLCVSISRRDIPPNADANYYIYPQLSHMNLKQVLRGHIHIIDLSHASISTRDMWCQNRRLSSPFLSD